MFTLDQGQALDAVGGSEDFKALAAQVVAQYFEDVWFVFDDDDLAFTHAGNSKRPLFSLVKTSSQR